MQVVPPTILTLSNAASDCSGPPILFVHVGRAYGQKAAVQYGGRGVGGGYNYGGVRRRPAPGITEDDGLVCRLQQKSP